VEKAKFLADVGFSQIVLARELDLPQIRTICAATASSSVLSSSAMIAAGKKNAAPATRAA
jgi:collagenase-like PrtC family protease